MDDPNLHAYGEAGPDDAEIGRRWRVDSSLKTWFPLTAERLVALEAENAALKRDLQCARDELTKGRTRMHEDNERLAHEAYTWSKAAETYAAELERHKPLMQAAEWLLDDGHMNTEHLARLRAAWEAALGPNDHSTRLPGRGDVLRWHARRDHGCPQAPRDMEERERDL